MAGRLERGEVRLYRFLPPDKPAPGLVRTRPSFPSGQGETGELGRARDDGLTRAAEPKVLPPDGRAPAPGGRPSTGEACGRESPVAPDGQRSSRR